MALYRDHVLPYCMDWVLGRAPFTALRRDLLAPVSGTALEIGFGTGLSLACYPAALRHLYTLDPYRPHLGRTRRRMARAPFPVQVLPYDGRGPYPLPAGAVDAVTSMFTLCTVPDVLKTLQQVRRVLKPGGRFIFLEHGAAEQERLLCWQRRLTPCWRHLAGGCHFDRPLGELLAQGGFRSLEMQRFAMPELPRIFGRLLRGEATV